MTYEVIKVSWNTRWKEIPGFPNYWVSNTNKIFNMNRRHLLSLYLNQHKTLCVRLYRNGKGKTRAVDKLRRVAFAEEKYGYAQASFDI